jgi:hypothetical protein
MAMNTYIEKYGNFSHILKIYVDDNVIEPERSNILTAIYELLHDKVIIKHIRGTDIPLKWRTADESHLFHYYTDGHEGMISDEGIRQHSSMLLKDIRETVGRDKVSILITKPLTQNICM